MSGKIIRVNGPIVVAKGLLAKMYDLVRVGEDALWGEVVKIEEDLSFIQVYEDTLGLSVGEEVINTGSPLNVELGPGLISSIFDGIQRPLPLLESLSGFFIPKGVSSFSLSREKRWRFLPQVKSGDTVTEGDILGKVKEKDTFIHYILVPVGISGKVLDIQEGEFSIQDTIATIESEDKNLVPVTMLQRWPVRLPRPIREKLTPDLPLITGQRVLDSLFPLAKGGTAIIPGGFGTGKTVLEQTLAKFSNCDIIIYVGCGERGNEMTSVLHEFPKISDPYTQKPLMDKAILIANTSNMPVAAREASVYVGVTIAEYFRDMGYDVALMADSTSRWAEALREISSRLEEMPAEEGYPPYLATRLSQFYERAGKVKCLGRDGRQGTLTIIGAVSPPGGDFSEPVTQASLRLTGVFWALDTSLAYRRHFPAINWSQSFTLYQENLRKWFKENISSDWELLLGKVRELLQKEEDIQRVAQVVGIEALPEQERIILESCGMIREVFLIQNAFDPIDGFCTFKRQKKLLEIILNFHEFSWNYKEKNLSFEEIINHPLKEEIARLKELKDEDFFSKVEELEKKLE
ncbi:MAG: V-type ATP synthase subunit A [Candidatus Omnitrophica bacterium]|nr:V-type ATP synthase subunit A [Candidatus Omnitrophota bacterium]